MTVTLIGFGGGTGETLSEESRRALERADLVLGAGRLLESLPIAENQTRVAETRASEIFARLMESKAEQPCAVFSGDTGFYSGAASLIPLLREAGVTFRVLPGLSSVQLLAARLGESWQDWALYSAHGTDCDPIPAVMGGRPAFFLTGGKHTPASLCRELTDAGLGALRAVVGENLSCPQEHIVTMSAAACAERAFAPLSVLLVEAAPRPVVRTGGLPDDAFARAKVPMTKQEVRAAALAKLAVEPADTVWDVGAGTGAMSVELALAARRGRAYAVEYGDEALALIRRNRERFGAWNLRVVPGRAPEALDALPAPDAVFIGGSGGRLAEIVGAILARNPKARLCAAAIALETLSTAVASFAAHGLDAEITQLGVSRAGAAGKLHLLLANNPVFLISGSREDGR